MKSNCLAVLFPILLALPAAADTRFDEFGKMNATPAEPEPFGWNHGNATAFIARLTWRHAGRNCRLTDVSGNLVKAILA